jgi:hypothetical protein
MGTIFHCFSFIITIIIKIKMQYSITRIKFFCFVYIISRESFVYDYYYLYDDYDDDDYDDFLFY